jgi:hypothetical protein
VKIRFTLPSKAKSKWFYDNKKNKKSDPFFQKIFSFLVGGFYYHKEGFVSPAFLCGQVEKMP